jgi:hypothetical protein
MCALSQQQSIFSTVIRFRVARFFMVHDNKTGKNVPNEHKCTKWSLNIPNVQNYSEWPKKYINIFHSKALQNLPKLVFLG